jgi:lysophospholipase L1-like esterase
LNQHAEQIRKLAKEFNVALVDSLAAFCKFVKAGGRLTDLMSQINHPNRKGHDLVVAELLKWFP